MTDCTQYFPLEKSKISGIHDIRVVECKGKRIFLLGEHHGRKESCSDTNDAILMNDFFKTMVENLHKKEVDFDMFLEQIYKLKTSTKLVEEKDVNQDDLNGMRSYAQNFKINHPNAKIRFHYTDVRDFLGALPYYTPGFNFSNISKLLNNQVKHNGKYKLFREDLVGALEEMYIDPLIQIFTWSSFPTGITLRKGNIVEKQARDGKTLLTADDISNLLKQMEEALVVYKKQEEHYVNYDTAEIIQYSVANGLLEKPFTVDKENPSKDDNIDLISSLGHAIQKVWVVVHDLYTVFRMYKSYISPCTMFYGGSNHTKSLACLLKRIGGKVVQEKIAPENQWSCLDVGTIFKTAGAQKAAIEGGGKLTKEYILDLEKINGNGKNLPLRRKYNHRLKIS